MDLNGFDYSWARPDPQQMAAAGIKVVARYLYGLGKGITVAERRALHAAWLGVAFNYEADRGNHLKGAAQGKIDGTSARSYAAGLGLPAGTPIYYSCDLEVSPAQMPTVLAYLHAADSAAHPSRAYGQASVCDAFGRPAWQTVAWSYGHVSQHAVMLQYQIDQDFHGSNVDYNTILNIDELGAWWPEGSEHNMPTADEIVKAVLDTPFTDTNGVQQNQSIRQRVVAAQAHAYDADQQSAALVAQVKALQAAVAKLTASGGTVTIDGAVLHMDGDVTVSPK